MLQYGHRGIPGGPCGHVGAAGDQYLHHIGMALVGGLHEGRGTTLGFPGIYIGAMVQQHLHGFHHARACSQHQRPAPQRQFFVGVGTAFQQCFNHIGLATAGSEPERGGAVAVGNGRVGACLQQQFGEAFVTMVGGPMQRRGAIGLAAVDVKTALHEATHFVGIAARGGVRHFRLRIGGGTQGQQQD